MRRRIRIFAGFLALIAMTASLFEAMPASLFAFATAVPAMALSTEDTAAGPALLCDSAECAAVGHTEASRDGTERCPLTPATTQGCTARASVPAPEIPVDVGTPMSTHHAALEAIEPELLIADGPYHSPRA